MLLVTPAWAVQPDEVAVFDPGVWNNALGPGSKGLRLPCVAATKASTKATPALARDLARILLREGVWSQCDNRCRRRWPIFWTDIGEYVVAQNHLRAGSDLGCFGAAGAA